MACLCFLFCAFFGIKILFFPFNQTDLCEGFDCLFGISSWIMVCCDVNNWTLYTAILVYGVCHVLGKNLWVPLFFFFAEWIILFKAKEDYNTGNHLASSLITLAKQGGLLQKLKEPQTLYNRLHLAREWAASLASLGTHVKDKQGRLEARNFTLWMTFSIAHGMSLPCSVIDLKQTWESPSTKIGAEFKGSASCNAHKIASASAWRGRWCSLFWSKQIPTPLSSP